MAELYDPYDAAVQDNPYPIYRALRDDAPVYRNEQRGFWALSRFDDVWDAVHDHDRFSSANGIVIGQESMASAAGDFMPMMIMMDPPRHDDLRKLVARAFTPKRIAAIEASIRSIARELLDSLDDHTAVDLVHDFAAPLPATVIADMLGVPVADRRQFREWSDCLVEGNPDDPATIERAITGAASLYRYFKPMLEDRRTRPGDDLMSALLEAQIDGEKLSSAELLGFCFLLLVAGNETTTNLISNAAVILHDHPDVRRRIADDPTRLPAAVEEFLRFESPVQGLARTLTADVELHGTRMAEGDKVLLLFASANRDEREFDDPDAFRLGRRTDRALAFGHGIHYCLGASLARLECRVAYEELLGRWPEFELTEGAERLRSGPIRGFAHLPLAPGQRQVAGV